MYRPAKKLREFPLKVYSSYLASKYLFRSTTYPRSAYVRFFGFVTNGHKIIGRVPLTTWIAVNELLRMGDNFCTISGSESTGVYFLEVWSHDFHMYETPKENKQ